MSITNSGQIHIVQNQEDSAANTTHILVNNHKKYSRPRHKDTNSSAQHNGEKTTRTHQEQELPNTQETEEEY